MKYVKIIQKVLIVAIMAILVAGSMRYHKKEKLSYYFHIAESYIIDNKINERHSSSDIVKAYRLINTPDTKHTDAIKYKEISETFSKM